MQAPIPFIILANSPVVRTGLCQALKQQPGWQVVGQGTSGLDMEILLAAHHPTAALVDWQLPLTPSDPRVAPENIFRLLAALPSWRLQFPLTAIWLLVENVFPCFLHLALQVGASGCVNHAEVQGETLAAALHALGHGCMYFSPQLQALWHTPLPCLPPLSLRQLAILAAFAQAPTQSTSFHAQRLHLSPSGLRARRCQICKCLGVTSITAAVDLAMQQGWLPS